MPVCPQCDNRPFSNKEALLQHMKSSSAWHPFCSICDRRFSSQMAYDAHMTDKHPPTFDCDVCNRSYHALFALEDHYRGSTAHPNCVRCGRGFKDSASCEEHQRTEHPKTQCTQCGGISIYEDALDHHYRDSHNHPTCHVCNLGFRDRQVYLEHFSHTHPELHCAPCIYNFETPEALQSHLWTSSLHPKCEPCITGFADSESYNSHLSTVHSTTASISADGVATTQLLNIANPNPEATNVPANSQTSTADIHVRSGTGYSPASVQLSPPTPYFPSPRNHVQALIVQGERGISSPSDLRIDLAYTSPLTEVKPLFSPTSPNPLPRPADDIERFWTSRENITTPRLPFSRTQPISNVISASTWLDSTQSHFRSRDGRDAVSPPMVSPPLTSPPALLPSPPKSSHRADFDSRLYPGSVRQAIRLQNDALGRRRVLGMGTRNWSTASQTSLVRYREPGGRPNEPSWSQSVGGEDSSQSVSSQIRGSIFYETLTPRGEASEGSPQSSWDYLGHSPGSHSNEPDTRPTTASSTPSILPITYTVTPSSECPSPHSPEVVSPTGLGVLPTISPLPSTPTDLIDFDIPEAKKPLPESPIGSPTTIVLDSIKSADQTDSSVISHLLTDNTTPPTTQTSPITSVALAATRSSSTTSNPNPLHCRVCLADTCDDITASMCGHIFCNRCITDAVIKTNRCPVCMTPTLLYCLFRLDLAA